MQSEQLDNEAYQETEHQSFFVMDKNNITKCSGTTTTCSADWTDVTTIKFTFNSKI